MARVRWEQLSPDLVEQMVAVLLNRIHGARGIDGAGGDGGRDVQYESDDGTHACEIKSFTGRMTSGRRAQVKASLVRAATLAPATWTLVVPLNPTPSELAWFDGLRPTVQFPIDWFGLTWLDAEMAQRPEIARYFLSDHREELEGLVALFRAEEAALTDGGQAVMARVHKLMERANELDPYYRFEINSDGVRSSISAIPRYAGADRDSPISASLSFEFPDDEDGRKSAAELRQAIDFGTQVEVPSVYVKDVEVDAPANLGRLSGSVSVQMGPGTVARPSHVMLLAAEDEAGKTLAEVPVELRVTSAGQRGSLLEGGDRSGFLDLSATMDVLGRSFQVTLETRALPFLPDELRPVARLLLRLVEPNFLVVRDEDGSEIGRARQTSDVPLVDSSLPLLLDHLSLLQWAAGMSRKVGPDFTQADLDSLARGVALIRGERLDASWHELTINVAEDAPLTIRQAMLGGAFPLTLRTPQPYVVTVSGIDFPIGRGTQMEIESAKVGPRRAAWRRDGAIPVGARVTLVPGVSDRAHLVLVGG